MIPDLKPYPAYKDSGVEWLGKVRGIGVYSSQESRSHEKVPLPRLQNMEATTSREFLLFLVDTMARLLAPPPGG